MELYFWALVVDSLNPYPRERFMYFMGFCLLSRGRVIVKKLDLARWREAVNTSWSLLTFAYFCSSSFSSRCNVLISVNNSGCLSLSLQELTSLQGVFLQSVLLWPEVWQKVHTFPRLSFAAGKSFKAFFSPCRWLVALSTCTSRSVTFS